MLVNEHVISNINNELYYYYSIFFIVNVGY